jgi:hypothetical protein
MGAKAQPALQGPPATPMTAAHNASGRGFFNSFRAEAVARVAAADHALVKNAPILTPGRTSAMYAKAKAAGDRARAAAPGVKY